MLIFNRKYGAVNRVISCQALVSIDPEEATPRCSVSVYLCVYVLVTNNRAVVSRDDESENPPLIVGLKPRAFLYQGRHRLFCDPRAGS